MANIKRTLIGTLFLILALLLPQTVYAANIYVTSNTLAPVGNGTNTSPYNSISAALQAAKPGDVVRLLPGTYYTDINFPHGGTVGQPITLTSDGIPLSAIIDCQNKKVNCVNITYGNIIVDKLTVLNPYYNGIKVDGDYHGSLDSGSYGNSGGNGQRLYRVNGADNVTIQNNYISNIGYDCIKIGHVNNVKILNNEIVSCGETSTQQGIDLVGVYNAVISGNYIHDEGAISSILVGFFAKGGSENILFENNIIQHIVSPYAAIEIGGDTEWYNTRYTPSNFTYDLNSLILTQNYTNNNIDNPETYQGKFMAEVRHIVVRGNIIIDSDPAISFRNSYNAKVYNNTIIDSGYGQGWVKFWDDGNHYHTVEEVKMYNNIFVNKNIELSSRGVYQNKSADPYPNNTASVTSDYNLFWNMNSTPNANLPGQDSHSIFVDPQLDTITHIPLPASPVIDAGINLTEIGIVAPKNPHIDRDGVLRPVNDNYDIGAMEYKDKKSGIEPNFYYVDGSSLGGICSDTNSGTESLPWCTIDRAKRSRGTVLAGDTVYIKGGSYLPITFSDSDSGTADGYITYKKFDSNPVTINGNGNYAVIIDGDYLILDGFTIINARENIRIRQGDNLIIRNCDLSQSVLFAAISFADADSGTHVPTDITIENCYIHDNGIGVTDHGIYLADGKNIKIINNVIENNFGAGILIQPHTNDNQNRYDLVDNVLISGNKISGNNGGVAIASYGGAKSTNIVIINNLFWNNKVAGISTILAADIYNNTFWNNTKSGIKIFSLEPGKDTNIINNIFYNNGNDGSWAASDIQFTTNEIDFSNFSNFNLKTNIYNTMNSTHRTMSQVVLTAEELDNMVGTNPLFVSTDNNSPNFLKISQNSPAIDTGSNLSVITTDYSGLSRNDGKLDLGAFESPTLNIPPAPTGFIIRRK